MPKRRNSKRVACDKVQGEDSFVIVNRPTVGESEKLRKERASQAEDDTIVSRSGLDFLSARISEWNWVDDAGDPLPQPKDDPGVMQLLTDEEISFLTEEIFGPSEEETGK